MFGLYRTEELPHAVAAEFEELAAGVGQLFSREHNEDGTHVNPPVGTIVLWPQVEPPTGWLVCDGRDVFQTDYPKLFKVLGITFGAGASGAFTLPDLTPPTDTIYIIFAG